MDSKLAAGRGGSPHPPVDLHQGQQLHGFEVKAITPIDELRAVTLNYRTNHSGARLLHLYTRRYRKPLLNQFPYPAIR